MPLPISEDSNHPGIEANQFVPATESRHPAYDGPGKQIIDNPGWAAVSLARTPLAGFHESPGAEFSGFTQLGVAAGWGPVVPWAPWAPLRRALGLGVAVVGQVVQSV
jgi:hypothetical protein